MGRRPLQSTGTKEAVSPAPDERFRVVVLGDFTEDRYHVRGGDPGSDDQSQPLKRPGGAYFVRDTLRSAFQSQQQAAPLGVCIETPFEHSAEHYAGHTDWHVEQYSGVWRCQPKPRAHQHILPNPQFRGYENQLMQDCSACVVEDLALNYANALRSPTDNALPSVHHFKEYPQTLFATLDSLNEKAKIAENTNDHRPLLYLLINRHLPRNSDDDFWKAVFSKDMQASHSALFSRTVVLVHADALRWSGVHISKQISWERTAQDFLSQWYTHQWLAQFHHFGHYMVRFGVTGALYTYKLAARTVHRLIFDPSAEVVGIYRDIAKNGDVVGHQSLLLARVMLELFMQASSRGTRVREDQATIADDMALGIKKSIMHAQHYYDAGLGNSPKTIIPPTPFLSLQDGIATDPMGHLDHASIPIADERIPVGCPSWNILTQASAYTLPKLAESIVFRGVENSLNRTGKGPSEKHHTLNSISIDVKVPVIRLGSHDDKEPLIVVDRREIESYRVVRNLIAKSHLAKTKRPLSIAVFGPPGAGKTTVVRKIVESAIDGDKHEFLPISLAQINKVDAVTSLLKQARTLSERQEGKLPVIFFDEFDSSFESKELGWLQYFLQFMEDKFAALFVFAGGTSSSFLEFTRESEGISDLIKAEFKMKKGPDFVSRLRGHINILGPNKVDALDDGYVIRRAVLLRSIFERTLSSGGVRIQRGGDINEYVSSTVVRAMLDITKYKHGARSIQAIVDMCARLGGEQEGRFVSSTLPTFEQLNMHVDGGEFIARLKWGRAI